MFVTIFFFLRAELIRETYQCKNISWLIIRSRVDHHQLYSKIEVCRSDPKSTWDHIHHAIFVTKFSSITSIMKLMYPNCTRRWSQSNLGSPPSRNKFSWNDFRWWFQIRLGPPPLPQTFWFPTTISLFWVDQEEYCRFSKTRDDHLRAIWKSPPPIQP